MMARALRRAILAGLISIQCVHAPAATLVVPLASALANLTQVGGPPLRGTEFRRKIVLLNFLATWCFPCLAGLPMLQEIQSRYSSSGLQVIAVGMDLEGVKVLQPFAQHYQLNFPLLAADDSLRSGETPFGAVTTLPTTFLLAEDGRILNAFTGVMPQKMLEAQIERALSESTD